MKSIAAVLTELKAPLEWMELEIPPLKKGQVLVEIKYSGICRTQVNEIKGLKGEDRFLPHTLGHEGSGIVLDVGEGVTKVSPGDHAVLTWIKGQGLENFSTSYQSGSLKVNSGPISTFLSHAIISENRLIPISKNIPLREAALFGCAIPTGAGIVFNEMDVKEDSTIAIFGLGGIGMSSLLAAKSKGAKKIIVIDREENKRKVAKEFGATHVHDYNDQLSEFLCEVTEGRGVDYSIEAVGKKQVMETAFKAVKDLGGLCVLAGNLPKGTNIECDPFDFIKGKRLIGTWGGRVNPDRDIPLFLKEFSKQKSSLEKMISHEIALKEINHAVDLLEQGKVARALIKF